MDIYIFLFSIFLSNRLNSSSTAAAVSGVTGTTLNDVVTTASPVSSKRRTGSSNVTPVTSRLNSPQLSNNNNNTNENGNNNDTLSSKTIGINKNNKLNTDNCNLNSKITLNKGTQTILSYPALNFFSSVSIGYDVLLHIFQYLKVQVS